MFLSKSKEKRALKFPIHSWPFCLRELILFTLLGRIFCTSPVTDSPHHPERQFSLSDTFPFTITGILLNCSWAAQASRRLVLFLPSTTATVRIFLSNCLLHLLPFLLLKTAHNLTHLFSVIFFRHVINASSVTSIPRPFCAPRQLPSHLDLSSLILTQALSCQLYNLYSFSLLFSYLKSPILGHVTACFFL